MNFHIGGLIAWRHDLPDYEATVKSHGKGPFELLGLRHERLVGMTEDQVGASVCTSGNCVRRNQEQHCLYLRTQTELGLVELPANKYMSLH